MSEAPESVENEELQELEDSDESRVHTEVWRETKSNIVKIKKLLFKDILVNIDDDPVTDSLNMGLLHRLLGTSKMDEYVTCH